jgi:formate C-acetyltransferase
MSTKLISPDLVDLKSHPALAFPPEEWKPAAAHERHARIRRRLLEDPREIDLARARLATESYRETEGEPMPVRRARMLLHLARYTLIAIDPDEMIVGNRSLKPRMGVIAPEGAVNWIDSELETLPTRPQDPFNIGADEIEELREEIFPYWRGQTLEDLVEARLSDEVKAAVRGKAFKLNQTDHAQGHILPDVPAWLHLGIGGLRAQVRTAQHTNPKADADFYESSSIALDAASEFISRYADLAGEQVEMEPDRARQNELAGISNTCHWLSENPARDFREALQAVWFLFVLLQIESNASSFSLGRFDQYMLPYLEHDLETGTLTLPEAQELLECLWLKCNEIVLLRSSSSARYFAGFPIGFNVTTGGQTRQGHDATNLLSFMCLRAQADLGMTQPNLSIRIHAGSPQDFLETAAFVISRGAGMPQVFNDEVIIPGQIHRGITPQDAVNYAVVGCVELSTPGKALGWSDAAMFNMARVLELTLFGGADPQTGVQVGLPTPALNEIASFEELEASYDKQTEHFIRLMIEGCNIVDAIHAEVLPSPFLSLVVEDCVARGVDVTAGGAHYNFSGVQGVQVANVADSLAAVEHAVFNEHWISGKEMLDALHENYAGHEVLRQRLLNCVPKYGNDDDRVDRFARQWANRYSELVGVYPTIRGGTFQPGFYTVSAHVPMGANVGATPDGRRAGEPLADGGLSPSAGRDLKGPTAMLNSVSKADLSLASNGTLLNMKFLPSFFEGERALANFVSLLRGFCSLHIPHVQFNVVSAQTLRDAQLNPAEYRSLVVRVAGYSAYFVELDRDLQDEIIRRTEFV